MITIKKTVSFHPIPVSFHISVEGDTYVITIKKTVSFHPISVSFHLSRGMARPDDEGAVFVLKCVLSFVIPCHSSFGLGSPDPCTMYCDPCCLVKLEHEGLFGQVFLFFLFYS